MRAVPCRAVPGTAFPKFCAVPCRAVPAARNLKCAVPCLCLKIFRETFHPCSRLHAVFKTLVRHRVKLGTGRLWRGKIRERQNLR